MLDLVGEIFEGAERDGLLGRINDVRVADGGVGNDDLGVALGSQGSRFEERFFEPHALLVDILASFHVVDCVDYEVEVGPEVVVEDFLVLGPYPQLLGLQPGVIVHLPSHSAGCLALVFADVLLSEQELPVQIADFDVVVIGDCDVSLFGGEPHQRKHFNELAAQSPGPDHERIGVGCFSEVLFTKDGVIVSVTISSHYSFHFALGEHFEEIVVKPLPERSVLSCELHYFLGNDSSPERTAGRNLSLGVKGHVSNQRVINAFNLEILSLYLHFGAQMLLDQGD